MKGNVQEHRETPPRFAEPSTDELRSRMLRIVADGARDDGEEWMLATVVDHALRRGAFQAGPAPE